MRAHVQKCKACREHAEHVAVLAMLTRDSETPIAPDLSSHSGGAIGESATARDGG